MYSSKKQTLFRKYRIALFYKSDTLASRICRERWQYLSFLLNFPGLVSASPPFYALNGPSLSALPLQILHNVLCGHDAHIFDSACKRGNSALISHRAHVVFNREDITDLCQSTLPHANIIKNSFQLFYSFSNFALSLGGVSKLQAEAGLAYQCRKPDFAGRFLAYSACPFTMHMLPAKNVFETRKRASPDSTTKSLCFSIQQAHEATLSNFRLLSKMK